MYKGKTTYLLLGLAMFFVTYSYAQSTYSTIAKNVNINAKNLAHDLNSKGDTLNLSGPFVIYKIEFIGNRETKSYDVNPPQKDVDVALETIPIGDYTVAVFQVERNDEIYQYQKTIVFRMSRLFPIEHAELANNDPIVIKKTEAVAAAKPKKEREDRSIAAREPRAKKSRTIVKKDKPIFETKKTIVDANKEVENKDIASTDTSIELVNDSPKDRFKDPKEVLNFKNKSLRSSKVEIPAAVLKSYNLSDHRDGKYVIESRADYRRNNLRPNGQPFD